MEKAWRTAAASSGVKPCWAVGECGPEYLDRPRSRARLPRLFADRVNRVFLVLAHAFDEFGVGEKFKLQRKRPGSGVGLGIVNRDFDVHVTEIAAAKAFDGVKRLGMRTAAVIDPALVVETARVDHEPVAIPLPDGIAEPGGTGHRDVCAAIREDLAVQRVLFIQNEGHAG